MWATTAETRWPRGVSKGSSTWLMHVLHTGVTHSSDGDFSLQANLAFAPAALLPGASPKSPGLKVMVSPFSTPPSTPSSPGIQPQSSEASETPVSFDKPPEGTQLQCYNKVGHALGLHHSRIKLVCCLQLRRKGRL